jgi:hypothetical protein
VSGSDLFRVSQYFDTDIDLHDFTSGYQSMAIWNDGVSGSPGYVPLNTWTHILFSVDTNQTVAADRVKIYKNGVKQVSYYSIPINQGDVFDDFLTSSSNVILGSSSGLTPYRGRLAFFQIIDGKQVLPTDVGQSVTGTWSHKPYSGDFGPHGFYFSGDNGMSTKRGTGNTYTFTNNGPVVMDYTDVPPYVSY